jgi:hypothetical protein
MKEASKSEQMKEAKGCGNSLAPSARQRTAR